MWLGIKPLHVVAKTTMVLTPSLESLDQQQTALALQPTTKTECWTQSSQDLEVDPLSQILQRRIRQELSTSVNFRHKIPWIFSFVHFTFAKHWPGSGRSPAAVAKYGCSRAQQQSARTGDHTGTPHHIWPWVLIFYILYVRIRREKARKRSWGA